MQLEKQVVSLELAKKLKSLGVKQESAIYWMEYLTSNGMDWQNRIPSREIYPRYPDGSDPRYWDFDNKISAFTVAELGEMLPGVLSGNCGSGFKAIRGSVLGTHAETCATEADARAKMLIYLIEKKIVKPKGRKG